MNDLQRYFEHNTGRQIHKWQHYFELYDRHLSRFRGTDVHVLEFGVAQGGSMQMWKQYFGPRCRIYGVDKNPACKQVEEAQVEEWLSFLADAIDEAMACPGPHAEEYTPQGGSGHAHGARLDAERFPPAWKA